jgi:hypothetical protein
MGGRQSNPVSNWFNDMADRARRAAEEAARRAREAAEMAMQQIRNAEENNNIIRIKSNIDRISGDNRNIQSHIYNQRDALWRNSRANDSKIFGLDQSIAYYNNENKGLRNNNDNVKKIIANNDAFMKKTDPKIFTQDNLNALTEVNLNKQSLYESIIDETETVIKRMPELKKIYSSDSQRTEYEKQKIADLDGMNTILFFLYYILFIVFAIMVAFMNKTASKYSKFTIIFILLIYPLVIYKLQTGIYLVLKNVYLNLEKNTYNTGY